MLQQETLAFSSPPQYPKHLTRSFPQLLNLQQLTNQINQRTPNADDDGISHKEQPIRCSEARCPQSALVEEIGIFDGWNTPICGFLNDETAQ